MKSHILSLYLVSILLSQSLCFANDNYQFDPVLQSNYGNSYQTQYPLPDMNAYQTQNALPVNNVYQAPNNNTNYNNYYNNEQLRGNVVMVPANTTFSAVLMTPLSSSTAKAGDGVSMFLASDFYYGKTLIAGAGSRVQGSVSKVRKGSYGNRNGQIKITLTNIVTPSGQIIPITASILTNDGTGILKAGTAKDAAKEYASKATIGAASGAVMGVIMGALSGGHVGKGAVYGTAVGGGMGLIQPIFERGGNVEIPQNAQFDIILNQPVTVSSNTVY